MNDQIMKLILVCLSIAFLPYFVKAQDIEVKKFEPMVKDQTAALSPRKDINGNDCALVLVRSLKKGLEFDGWVVGDVEYKNDSYWVYMANGAKNLKIKHPDYQTKAIAFGDYGIGSIKGGQIYGLCIVDDTKDVINKVYSLGWNLKGFDISQKVKTILFMSAMGGDKRAIISMAQLSEENSSRWIDKLLFLENGDSTCLDSMSAECMYYYGKDDRYYYYDDKAFHYCSGNKANVSKYLFKACQKGYKKAGDVFFLNYISGNGLFENRKEVLQLCMDSATIGNHHAMTCLGYIFEKGICEDVNLQAAAKWFIKADEVAPSTQSKSDLCRLYGNKLYPLDDMSMNFIRQQAEEGLPEALFQLGCMYEEGRNVGQSIEKAIEYYKQCSDKNEKASYHLAKIYYDRKDYQEAIKFLHFINLDNFLYVSNNLHDSTFKYDALYLKALIMFYCKEDEEDLVNSYIILSKLSETGYKKASNFIKNNY